MSFESEILDLFLTRDVCYGEQWLFHSSVSQFLVLLSFSLRTTSTAWPFSLPGDGGSSARRQYSSAVPSRPTKLAACTSYSSPLAPANQHKIKSKTNLKFWIKFWIKDLNAFKICSFYYDVNIIKSKILFSLLTKLSLKLAHLVSSFAQILTIIRLYLHGVPGSLQNICLYMFL